MINILVIFIISLGLLFFLGAVVGIFRFPDFYTRCHAAGKGDTLSTALISVGIAIYYMNINEWTLASILVALKIMFIVAFYFIASPTSTHVLTQAGMNAGIIPFKKPNSNSDKAENTESKEEKNDLEL